MFMMINGKPCQVAWQLKVWCVDKETGKIALKKVGPLIHSQDSAMREIRRKHITKNNVQYNLYKCGYHKGDLVAETMIARKDTSGEVILYF